jgi:hypothetical protein
MQIPSQTIAEGKNSDGRGKNEENTGHSRDGRPFMAALASRTSTPAHNGGWPESWQPSGQMAEGSSMVRLEAEIPDDRDSWRA